MAKNAQGQPPYPADDAAEDEIDRFPGGKVVDGKPQPFTDQQEQPEPAETAVEEEEEVDGGKEEEKKARLR